MEMVRYSIRYCRILILNTYKATPFFNFIGNSLEDSRIALLKEGYNLAKWDVNICVSIKGLFSHAEKLSEWIIIFISGKASNIKLVSRERLYIDKLSFFTVSNI